MLKYLKHEISINHTELVIFHFHLFLHPPLHHQLNFNLNQPITFILLMIHNLESIEY
jgi:hypothetical protein